MRRRSQFIPTTFLRVFCRRRSFSLLSLHPFVGFRHVNKQIRVCRGTNIFLTERLNNDLESRSPAAIRFGVGEIWGVGALNARVREILAPAKFPVPLNFAHSFIQLFALVLRELTPKATVLNPFEAKVFASIGNARACPIILDVVNDQCHQFRHISPDSISYQRKLKGLYAPFPRRKPTSERACI